MTQVQLADKAGVSRAYLATIETPVTAPYHRTPSPHTLRKLAKALGIHVGQLVK
jgi:transcriptional regulator with XRE-family HTH domain